MMDRRAHATESHPRGPTAETDPDQTDGRELSWDDLIAGWLAVIEPACAECGYPLKEVPRPLCPECGRVVTMQDLARAVVPPGTVFPDAEPRLWRTVRLLGAWRAWMLQAMALVILAAAGQFAGQAATASLLSLALLGLLVSVGVAYVQLMALWVQAGAHRGGVLREHSGFDTLRGMIGTFVSGCEAMALFAMALRL